MSYLFLYLVAFRRGHIPLAIGYEVADFPQPATGRLLYNFLTSLRFYPKISGNNASIGDFPFSYKMGISNINWKGILELFNERLRGQCLPHGGTIIPSYPHLWLAVIFWCLESLSSILYASKTSHRASLQGLFLQSPPKVRTSVLWVMCLSDFLSL